LFYKKRPNKITKTKVERDVTFKSGSKLCLSSVLKIITNESAKGTAVIA
jgi:hypothetical protein